MREIPEVLLYPEPIMVCLKYFDLVPMHVPKVINRVEHGVLCSYTLFEVFNNNNFAFD